jgi:hypothetical protein
MPSPISPVEWGHKTPFLRLELYAHDDLRTEIILFQTLRKSVIQDEETLSRKRICLVPPDAL